MRHVIGVVLLVAIGWQDMPNVRSTTVSSNQRIQELQNRHDRRFRSDWYPRRSAANRFR
jgi:hypothetical protein